MCLERCANPARDPRARRACARGKEGVHGTGGRSAAGCGGVPPTLDYGSGTERGGEQGRGPSVTSASSGLIASGRGAHQATGSA